MAQSNPTGKQNTFAGHVLPEMVMVEFKQRKVPLSYANAFAEPVSLRKGHVVRESIEKLAKEVDLMDGAYALSVTHRAWMALRGDQKPTICDTFRSMKDMVQACANWAKE
jgi:CRISPR system Cascade subunit CasC